MNRRFDPPTTSKGARLQVKVGTKDAKLFKLLARSRGATRNELAHAAGWVDHTVRGWLSHLKRRGIELRVQDELRGHIYRISPEAVTLSAETPTSTNKMVRLTVLIPVEAHENLELCRVKLRVSRNELMNEALNRLLIQEGFDPHRLPKISVSY